MRRVTVVTATRLTLRYLQLIGATPLRDEGATHMTKFYALIAACAVFAPMAFATLNQAAQIVA